MPNIQDLIAAEVDRQLKRRLGAMQIPILTQQNGTPVSGGHRVLNFQGAGVGISDDPSNRRVNIDIPGAPITSSSQTTISSTAGTEKVFTLTSDNFSLAPSGWQNVGFSDASWSASVLMTSNISAFYTGISGADWVSDHAGGVTTPAGCLVRRTFTLPAGTVTAATLTINIDDYTGTDHSLYLNGTSISSGLSHSFYTSGPPLPPSSISVSPSLLSTGGSNVLAVHVADDNTGTSSPHSVAYQLVVTYTNATAPLSNVVASDVTMTTANTFYDGPSLSVSAGTWLLVGSVDVQNLGTNGVMTAKLWDGTNPAVATADDAPTSGGGSASLPVFAVVTPASTTTYKISAACQQANAKLKAASTLSGSPVASYLLAVRLL